MTLAHTLAVAPCGGPRPKEVGEGTMMDVDMVTPNLDLTMPHLDLTTLELDSTTPNLESMALELELRLQSRHGMVAKAN